MFSLKIVQFLSPLLHSVEFHTDRPFFRAFLTHFFFFNCCYTYTVIAGDKQGLEAFEFIGIGSGTGSPKTK